MGRPVIPPGGHGEITVKRLGTRWEADVLRRDNAGKLKRVRRRGDTKARARAVLEAHLAEVEGGAGQATVSELLAVWEDEKRGTVLPRSWPRYTRAATLLRESMGAVDPSTMTPAMIQGTLDEVARVSPSNAKMCLSALRAVVRLAAMRGLLTRDPLLGVQVRAVSAPEPRAMTLDEAPAFRAVMAAYTHPAGGTPDTAFMEIFDLIAVTGCRPGEALGMMWEQLERDAAGVWWWTIGTIVTVDERGRALVQPFTKTRTVRRVTLPHALVNRLGTPGTGLVFPARYGGPRGLSAFSKTWERRRTQNVAPGQDDPWAWVTPKTLRKTAATLIAETAGADSAARQLGHTTDKMTRAHYIQARFTSDHAALLSALIDSDTDS